MFASLAPLIQTVGSLFRVDNMNIISMFMYIKYAYIYAHILLYICVINARKAGAMDRQQALLANIIDLAGINCQYIQLVACTIKHYGLVIYRKNKAGAFLSSLTNTLSWTNTLAYFGILVQASTTTHSITKNSLTIIRITALSIKGLFATLSINDTQHINTVIMLSFIMLCHI
jgi:hypothetical protein